MMDDWSFQPPTFGDETVAQPPEHTLEQFRDDRPAWIKWGVNYETGEPVCWQVEGGMDGRPGHRAYLRDRWGRDAVLGLGDRVGIAKYTPAEVRLDGQILTPARVQIGTYYGKDTPSTLVSKFGEIFPNAEVKDDPELLPYFSPKRGAVTSGWEPYQETFPAEANFLKWLWHPQHGARVWRTDANGLPTHENIEKQLGLGRQDPLIHRGIVEEPEFAIEPYRGLPPRQCISDVKNEVAKQFPDQEVKLPETQEDYGIEESYGTDGPQFQMSAKWAQQNLAPLEYRFAAADMSGAMIAVYLPEEVGKKIKQDGEDAEPVDRMHITLVYFKDKAADRDDWSKVEEIVKDVAGKTKKLHGEIGGYGVFQNNPDGDVLWAAPSVDGLAELRDELVERVEEAGFEINRDHGWTPHITLIYGFEGSLPKLEKELPVTFDNLTFARGEDKREVAFKYAHVRPVMSHHPAIRAENGGYWQLNGGGSFKHARMHVRSYAHPGYETYAIPFVTDGKIVRIDMEPEEFLRMYPPDDRDYVKAQANLVTGWLTPTKDGLGYGIHGGVGLREDQPGAHEIMALLDQETGKPCHFVPDQGSWSTSKSGLTSTDL